MREEAHCRVAPLLDALGSVCCVGKLGVNFVEVPLAYDGIAVVVNTENTWAKDMTFDELRDVWRPEAMFDKPEVYETFKRTSRQPVAAGHN